MLVNQSFSFRLEHVHRHSPSCLVMAFGASPPTIPNAFTSSLASKRSYHFTDPHATEKNKTQGWSGASGRAAERSAPPRPCHALGLRRGQDRDCRPAQRPGHRRNYSCQPSTVFTQKCSRFSAVLQMAENVERSLGSHQSQSGQPPKQPIMLQEDRCVLLQASHTHANPYEALLLLERLTAPVPFF